MKIQGENEYKYFNILLLQNFFLHFYVEVYSSEQMFLIVSSSTINTRSVLFMVFSSIFVHASVFCISGFSPCSFGQRHTAGEAASAEEMPL